MNKKLNNKGMTLPELLIGMAVSSIVVLGSYQAYTVYNEYSKHSERVKSQKILMKNLFKIGKRATRILRIPAFDISRSYSLSSDGELAIASWDPLTMANAASSQELSFNFMTDNGSEKFHELTNDSFTMELMGNEGRVASSYTEVVNGVNTQVSFNSVNGMLISRCINKNQVDHDFTIEEALNLDRAPFSYFDANSQFRVACCPIFGAGLSNFCTDGDIIGENANWRTRIFMANQKIGLTTFPKKGDIRFFTSAGFTFYFNDPADPQSYKMYFFSLVDSCQSAIDEGRPISDCKPRRVLNREILTGNLSRDWGQSGIISIDE